MNKKPRPYQRDALRWVLAYAVDHPTGRLILVIPPRGGKTLVGALVVLHLAVRHGLRALWLVHREELLDEAIEHLVDVGIHRASIGVIKAGRSSDPDARIQVASEQTLDRRGKLPVAHLVVTDECHLDTAPRRRRLRRAYPKAFLLGLTATPKPPPQRDLGEDYDAMMVVVQPSELIHDGFLAVPTVYAPDRSAIPDLRGLRRVGGDYRPDDLEPLLMRRGLLDEQVSEWARLSEGRISLAYPVTIAHSKALVARFQAHGINAKHLDGETPAEGENGRRAILKGLNEGTLPIGCSVGVVSVGTNLPRVKCILGVRPTFSLVLYTQQGMRCATPFEGIRPRILDVVGNCYVHGYPFEDRRWSLKNAESGIPIREGAHHLKRCPSCGAMMHPATLVCTACAAAFPVPPPVVPDVPLTLHEVTPAQSKLREEQSRLLLFARDRGFSDPDEWVARVMERKHGAEARP